MLSTRLDVARRLGGLLTAAQKGGMSFCNMSFSPRVTDGLDSLNATTLARFLMNADKVLRSYTKPSETTQTNQPRQTAGRAK